jgi:hypothetical protein
MLMAEKYRTRQKDKDKEKEKVCFFVRPRLFVRPLALLTTFCLSFPRPNKEPTKQTNKQTHASSSSSLFVASNAMPQPLTDQVSHRFITERETGIHYEYNGTETRANSRHRRPVGSPARSYFCLAVAAMTIRKLLRLDAA